MSQGGLLATASGKWLGTLELAGCMGRKGPQRPPSFEVITEAGQQASLSRDWVFSRPVEEAAWCQGHPSWSRPWHSALLCLSSSSGHGGVWGVCLLRSILVLTVHKTTLPANVFLCFKWLSVFLDSHCAEWGSTHRSIRTH